MSSGRQSSRQALDVSFIKLSVRLMACSLTKSLICFTGKVTSSACLVEKVSSGYRTFTISEPYDPSIETFHGIQIRS